MKLFGNQQLECLQGYIFSRQKHINILDPPSHQKKNSLPHNFHSFTNFSRYLEVLGIWMYLFENITLFFVHFAGLGTFTRFPHSIHTSMLEYASAGPCTLHPMRFPEATFFLATYLYIYIYISHFNICTIYIHTSTDWNFECYAPFLRGVYRQLECSMMPHLSFQYIFIYLNLNILGQHSNCLFVSRDCAAF